MKRLVWFLVSFTVLFMAAAANASIIDVPHNPTNHIGCGSCHSYSLWWQGSPAPDRGQTADGVCQSCHGSGGMALYKASHNSLSMGKAEGLWGTHCVDCHDPHTQPQLEWRFTNEDKDKLYLVQGTIGEVSPPANGTTTFQYTLNTGKTISQPWTAPATWSSKNSSGRGLVLVDDIDTAHNTFSVAAATATTITVKGELDSSSTGNSFGLIYGQLVKQTINTPTGQSRTVKFFDPNILYGPGGFTDPTTPTQGICQVCHASTKYWRNNGQNADPASALHNPTIVCTACHLAKTGFKPSGGPHTFLGESAACVTCHQSGDILGVHKNNCQNCHTTPPELADPANKPLVTAILRGTCLDCHGTLAHPSGTAHGHRQITESCTGCHAVADATAVDALHKHDCGTCHGYSGTKIDQATVAGAIATGISGTDVNCQTCHTVGHATETDHNHRQVVASCASCHAVSDATAVDALHNNDCLTCHNYSGTKLSKTTVDEAIAAGKSGQDVNCQTCHTVGHDSATAHNHRLAASLCTECHAVLTPAAVDTLHRGDCTTCHGYSGTKLNPATVAAVIASGISGTDVNCQSCHLDDNGAAHHLTANAVSGNCTACHIDPRPFRNGITPGDNGGTSPYPTQLACRQCHVRVVGTTIYVDKLTFDVNNGGPVTRTNGQHTIAGVTSGAILNYGMCLSCHDGNKATKVTVYHAKPKNRVDTAAKAATPPPGRGTFNLFYTELTTIDTDEPFRYTTPRGDTTYRSIRRTSQNPWVSYKSIAIPCNATNGCTSGSTVNVPVLPAFGVPPDLYIASIASPAGEGSAVLTGTFNTDGTPPQVTVGPYPATVSNWSATTITFSAASYPCDYYWPVVVKANGNNSNQVSYTGCHYTSPRR